MKPSVHEGTAFSSRRGTSLVEVMVGCLILAVLALGFATSLQYAKSMSVKQRDRRTALELANSRLEELRGAAYSQVWPSASNYNIYYLRQTGTTWVASAGATNENVVVNNRTWPMKTTVQYVDVDAGSASYDALRFNVSVRYDSGVSNLVSLETLRAP